MAKWRCELKSVLLQRQYFSVKLQCLSTRPLHLSLNLAWCQKVCCHQCNANRIPNLWCCEGRNLIQVKLLQWNSSVDTVWKPWKCSRNWKCPPGDKGEAVLYREECPRPVPDRSNFMQMKTPKFSLFWLVILELLWLVGKYAREDIAASFWLDGEGLSPLS